MLPVLAAGMGLLPFWYVLFTSHSYKKLMNNEIETGLSTLIFLLCMLTRGWNTPNCAIS